MTRREETKMSKCVKRVIPFESSDIPAIQKWLEDMAQQGLFYKGCGVFCAEFEKGEPRQTRYRLDFCDVVACDIPDEKKEMYEKNGWQVVGEFKSDLIVLRTDDPEAPEIYTEHSHLVKPLKKLARKHMAYWIAFLLMFLYTRIGYPLEVLISGKGSVVSSLIEIGTLKYALFLAMALLLLVEFIVQFKRWRHLKKLIKNIERGGELPQGESYRKRARVGAALIPLRIPLIVLWAIHIVMPINGLGDAIDPSTTSLPVPAEIAAEIQSKPELDNRWSEAYERSDLLCPRIIRTDYTDDTGSQLLEYDVEFYDMRCESFAKEFVEGEIDETVNYDRLEYKLRMEAISANDKFDYQWDGFMPEYTLTELEKDDAEIHHITEKYGEPENCVRQIMYIRLGNRLVRVWYQGPDDQTDYIDMYIDYLKNAE